MQLNEQFPTGFPNPIHQISLFELLRFLKLRMGVFFIQALEQINYNEHIFSIAIFTYGVLQTDEKYSNERMKIAKIGLKITLI